MEETELYKKRFKELAARSYNAGIFTFTDFLGLSEQAAFEEVRGQLGGAHFEASGGAEGTERVIIRFGDPEELGYEEAFPISILKVEPTAPRFAEKLTHRDLLGALMNLGIERKMLGDIAMAEGSAYIFVKEEMAAFIAEELRRVRHTDVAARITEALPTGELYKTERATVQVASERLDAVIAKLYALSREEAQKLFKRELIFVGGRLCESVAYMPKAGDVISVRGYGRFIYRSYETMSRKGKLNVVLDVYVS